MKHLDPLSLAALADGSLAGAGDAAHLRACAQCRAELATLRELCRDLGQAPVPSPALRQATLQRLGLRPHPRHRLRWAWAPLLATALLAWLLPLTSPQKVPAPAAANQALVHVRTPSVKTAARPAPAPAVELSLEQTEEPANPAVGLSSIPVEAPQTRVVDGTPKVEAPAALQELKVQVRGNLIRSGESLVLTVELPQGGNLTAQVFDARGHLIATLHQGPAGPGPVNLSWDAAGAPSAVYTVLLKSGAHSKQIKVVVAH